MFEHILENVHIKRPLVHSITNYVSINDCANIVLASRAYAIMAEDVNEAAEITSKCDGLNINMGMLDEAKLEAMLLSGKTANMQNKPVVLDPVGVGASAFRRKCAARLLKEVKFSVIRGNLSEIKALSAVISMLDEAGANKQDSVYTDGYDSVDTNESNGVDAAVSDRITEDNLMAAVEFARKCARKTNCVVAITGAIDIVTDSTTAYCIRNGHPMMGSVTGAGCQLSALTASFVAANPDNILEACAAAVAAMGICGETAYSRMNAQDGNATYRNYIIDAVYNLTDDKLVNECKVEIIK